MRKANGGDVLSTRAWGRTLQLVLLHMETASKARKRVVSESNLFTSTQLLRTGLSIRSGSYKVPGRNQSQRLTRSASRSRQGPIAALSSRKQQGAVPSNQSSSIFRPRVGELHVLDRQTRDRNFASKATADASSGQNRLLKFVGDQYLPLALLGGLSTG